MAVPPIVIKAALTAATDKRFWKVVAIIITAILMPIILFILMIAAMFSGVETANNNLLDYSFAGVSIPGKFTEEQRGAIEDMRDRLGELDEIIAEKEKDEECSLGMAGNRRFPEGIVAGPFFICGDDGEDFCSLTDEQCEKYVREFSQPQEITQDEVEQDMKIEITFF